jgi:YaaC-like Protein
MQKNTPIDKILDDHVSLLPATDGCPFNTTIDYTQELNKSEEAKEEWKKMSKLDQARHHKMENYLQLAGVADFKSKELIRARDWHRVKNEIKAQIDEINHKDNPLKLLSVEELYFSSSLLELLENIENTEQVQELYKLRKRTAGQNKGSGIASDKARCLKNCLRQGRELYISGKTGSLMVKPLNLFYSLTAYAYAIIILNSPIRFDIEVLPGSHGLNYQPGDVRTQFGGDIKQGTFSELFTAFPTTLIRDKKTSIIQDNESSLLAFYNTKITVSTGILMSMVPEIRDYYSLVTGKPSRTYRLEIAPSSDVRAARLEFQIGDGETRPSETGIKNAFENFHVAERNGKTIVTVPFADVHKIRATIYSDIRGKFWYVENPFFPIILPELCLHFLLTNAFSNIMRYSPQSWGEILSNEGKSDISLITRKYLSAFENKLPILLLRSLSRFHPIVTAEG